MKQLLTKPQTLTDRPFHYCPGCTHGIAHRLVAEVIEELGLAQTTIGVASVGCSVLAYDYFNLDMQQAAHGRAPAVATGIKRAMPDKIVFTYQGDGDLASIGMGEIIHAAARGEKITVVFVNNAIYGMTGGQMAPTTLMGQKSTTTPLGRSTQNGFPIRISEMLALLDGVSYISRVSLTSPGQIILAKKALKTAFSIQVKGLGFSLVEILSTCPTNWGLSPQDSLKYVKEKMTQVYPLGEFKKPEGEI